MTKTITLSEARAYVLGAFLRGKPRVLPGEEHILSDIVWDSKMLAKYVLGLDGKAPLLPYEETVRTAEAKGEKIEVLSASERQAVAHAQAMLDKAIDKLEKDGILVVAPRLGPNGEPVEPGRGGKCITLSEQGIQELTDWSRSQAV